MSWSARCLGMTTRIRSLLLEGDYRDWARFQPSHPPGDCDDVEARAAELVEVGEVLDQRDPVLEQLDVIRLARLSPLLDAGAIDAEKRDPPVDEPGDRILGEVGTIVGPGRPVVSVIRPDEDDIALPDVPPPPRGARAPGRPPPAGVGEDEERRLAYDALQRNARDVGSVLEVVERSLHVRPHVAPEEDLGHDAVRSGRPEAGVVGLELLDEAVRDLEGVLLLPREERVGQLEDAKAVHAEPQMEWPPSWGRTTPV